MADHQVYMEDVKKYSSNPNESQVEAIVKHLGIALQGPDTSKVACSQPSERERIRENFLKKKLKLSHSDADLDSAIEDICQTMSPSGSEKNRVTFYYLLAEKMNASL